MEEIEKYSGKTTAFVMILPGGKGYVLSLKKNADITADFPDDTHPEIAKLDVSILHQYVFARVWVGNPEIELDDQDIYYVKDPGAALKMLTGPNPASAVFLMNAPQMEQVHNISNAGMRMPHKTTFFYPKLLSGLVMRDHSAPW